MHINAIITLLMFSNVFGKKTAFSLIKKIINHFRTSFSSKIKKGIEDKLKLIIAKDVREMQKSDKKMYQSAMRLSTFFLKHEKGYKSTLAIANKYKKISKAKKYW